MIRIIGGDKKGFRLKTPKGNTTRPTQEKLRKSLFDIIQFSIEGARFLDLFAGSGAIGIEALSRGASHCTFIDKDPKAIQCIKENLSQCGLAGSVKKCDAIKGLTTIDEAFDYIYIDPPYPIAATVLPPIIETIGKRKLIANNGRIFIEYGSKETREIEELLQKVRVEKKRVFGGTTLLQTFFPS